MFLLCVRLQPEFCPSSDRRALTCLAIPGVAWLTFAVFWDRFVRQNEFTVFATPIVTLGLYCASVVGLVGVPCAVETA